MKFAKTALCFLGIRNTVAPPTGEETVSLAGSWRWSNYKQIYKENENFFDFNTVGKTASIWGHGKC